jgi:hypothetical protein
MEKKELKESETYSKFPEDVDMSQQPDDEENLYDAVHQLRLSTGYYEKEALDKKFTDLANNDFLKWMIPVVVNQMHKAYQIAKSEDAERIKELEALLKRAKDHVPYNEWRLLEQINDILIPKPTQK